LRGRAVRGQRFPALAGEQLLVLLVGELGVGDPEAASEVVAAGRGERRSVSVSTRETKKLATEWTRVGSPP